MQEDIELMWKAALMASAKKKKKSTDLRFYQTRLLSAGN